MNTLFARSCKAVVVTSFYFLCCLSPEITAQEKAPEPVKQEKKWYETIQLRGYVQFRYNRLLETNDKLKCEQCDRSWGENGGFFLRRARLIFFGNISKNVYFYIQPDFASNASSNNLHFGQIRDAYFDIGFDDNNEYRLRLGQSKIPFGFENLQSSQNRMPLDRADPLNSALSNERDLGAIFYYAPKAKRDLFSKLVRDGLKGSGDYGVFALGVYNGQTANRPELNNQPHIVARISYPFFIGSQIIEPGIHAFKGIYTLGSDQISNGVNFYSDKRYVDERAALSFVLYPQPFGIQMEYNVGRGAQYDPATDSIVNADLKGGYVLISYRYNLGNKTLFPFIRYQNYAGGKKHELDARNYDVSEFNIGTEIQLSKQLEVVAEYVVSSRRFEDHGNRDNLQKGNLLRLQAQINF